MKMMKMARSNTMIVFWLALLPTLAVTLAVPTGVHHHSYDPLELDVDSKSCDYNSLEGYAGNIGTTFYTVEYFYSMVLNASQLENDVISYNQPVTFLDVEDDSLQGVVLSVEFEVASFMLKESSAFKNAPCNSRRRTQAHRTRPRDRRAQTTNNNLVNVGLTLGPDDEIVAECPTPVASSTDLACYEVAGYFDVFTVGSGSNTTESEREILDELSRGMNQGRFDDIHHAIVSVRYLNLTPPTVDKVKISDDGSETDQEGTPLAPSTSVAVIVVASVGSILLVIGVVLLRRRRYDREFMDRSRLQPHNESLETSLPHSIQAANLL